MRTNWVGFAFLIAFILLLRVSLLHLYVRDISNGVDRMTHTEPFRFNTVWSLVELTGLEAHNLQELAATLRDVPGSCVFHHTHDGFLSHHFEKPVVYNDFASWVADALQEDELAEKLASIDLLAFTTIRDLREAIIVMIESHLRRNRGYLRPCPPGDEFHFCESRSFVIPTGLVAHDVPEFFERLRTITNSSLYFHFLEARLRIGRPTNDFSHWLMGRGEVKLAEAVNNLDPYSLTLEELKDEIIALGAA
ncbi:MAG TPA: DUF5752 family protein [Terriglobales bacterium]|nr:DUF5752 family protein [Terriglobales bacterium]